MVFFFLMIRLPPRSTRTVTPFPYSALFPALDSAFLSAFDPAFLSAFLFAFVVLSFAFKLQNPSAHSFPVLLLTGLLIYAAYLWLRNLQEKTVLSSIPQNGSGEKDVGCDGTCSGTIICSASSRKNADFPIIPAASHRLDRRRSTSF